VDKYTPEEGDYVRVVIEGRVDSRSTFNDWFSVGDFEFYPTEVASVEKIDPPVVQFKPGDTVRDKHRPEVFTLGVDGYLDHQNWQWYPAPITGFDSQHYELMEEGI